MVGLALMAFYFNPMDSAKKMEVDAAFFEEVFTAALEVIKRADTSESDIMEILLVFDAVCCDQARAISGDKEMNETAFRAAAHASGVVPNTLMALLEEKPGKLGTNN
jgi:hypothetical protein